MILSPPLKLCPHRSKWKYQTTAILLAFMMVYLLFCAVMCAVKAADGGSVAFRTMVFSVIITYGGKGGRTEILEKLSDLLLVYFISGILAMDPWHLFTSFIPYLLLSPTYINVLNM